MSEEQQAIERPRETLKEHALRLIKEIQVCPESMGTHCIQVLCDELEPLIRIALVTSPADLAHVAQPSTAQVASAILDQYEPHEGCAICPDCYRRLKREFSAALTTAVDRQRGIVLQGAANTIYAMSRIDARDKSIEFLSGAAWMQDKAAKLLESQAAAIRNAK